MATTVFDAGVNAVLEQHVHDFYQRRHVPYSTARALLMSDDYHLIRNGETLSLWIFLERPTLATKVTFVGQPCPEMNASRARWLSSGHKRCG
jgi:hypothetical protein